MNSYKKVDIKEYVTSLLENKDCKIILASKHAFVVARKGIVGEEIITYTSNGLEETRNVVGVDEFNNPDYVVARAINNEVATDKYGHKNEMIIKDEVFKAKYDKVEGYEYLYSPKPIKQKFIMINEDISFKAPWGEIEYLSSGGYINITDLDRSYGIQKEEFLSTYTVWR